MIEDTAPAEADPITQRFAVMEAESDKSVTVPQMPANPRDEGRWIRHAECGPYSGKETDPELFHPIGAIDKPGAVDANHQGSTLMQIAAAQSVCARCPVRESCRDLRYELSATGIWAGVLYDSTGGKRCATRGCRKPVLSFREKYCGFEHNHAATVGTRAGYDAHAKWGTERCRACVDAYTKLQSQYRDRKRGRAETASRSRTTA